MVVVIICLCFFVIFGQHIVIATHSEVSNGFGSTHTTVTLRPLLFSDESHILAGRHRVWDTLDFRHVVVLHFYLSVGALRRSHLIPHEHVSKPFAMNIMTVKPLPIFMVLIKNLGLYKLVIKLLALDRYRTGEVGSGFEHESSRIHNIGSVLPGTRHCVI